MAGTLYTYYRSGAAHRVRIALALKGISYQSVAIHLVRGEQLRPEYRAINPQARVPAFQLPSGEILLQSPAILEYLEETAPKPPLLPADPIARAKVRAVAAIIGCDIHPINNVAVLNALRALGQGPDAVQTWIADWINRGFTAVEQLIGAEDWCFGAGPGLADIFLVPQIFSARRFKLDLAPYPRIRRIEALAAAHPAFTAAAPEHQPDAE